MRRLKDGGANSAAGLSAREHRQEYNRCDQYDVHQIEQREHSTT